MNQRLRRAAAGLALAAAAATGLIVTTELVAPRADTTWGAPDTTHGDAAVLPPAGDDVSTLITPMDTTWG